MKNNYIPVSIRKLLSQRWESDKHYIEGDKNETYLKRNYDDYGYKLYGGDDKNFTYTEVHEMIADGALDDWSYYDDGEGSILLNANVEDSLKAFLVDASEAWERHKKRIEAIR